MNVIKRDGSQAVFDATKIKNAILGVNNDLSEGMALDESTARSITDEVVAKCGSSNRDVSVEDIQDMVERALCEHGHYEAAKQYIIYRYRHTLARQNKILTEKLTASNVQNQNANVDEASFGGRLGEAASFVTKQYALDHLMSPMAVRNHLNNEIYTHDLDSYALGSHNCLSIPFDKLLAEGFNTRQTDVRPAGSINTAFQLVAVIFQLQSLQQFGGVAATHLDWTMVPYVRLSFYKHYKEGLHYICKKDLENDFTTADVKSMPIDGLLYVDEEAYKYALDLTTKELNQAVEGMYHNLDVWVA